MHNIIHFVLCDIPFTGTHIYLPLLQKYGKLFLVATQMGTELKAYFVYNLFTTCIHFVYTLYTTCIQSVSILYTLCIHFAQKRAKYKKRLKIE
jgi:hypothetical protein